MKMGIIKTGSYRSGLSLPYEILVNIVGNEQDALLGNLCVPINISYNDLVDILAEQVNRFGGGQRDRQDIIRGAFVIKNSGHRFCQNRRTRLVGKADNRKIAGASGQAEWLLLVIEVHMERQILCFATDKVNRRQGVWAIVKTHTRSPPSFVTPLQQGRC